MKKKTASGGRFHHPHTCWIWMKTGMRCLGCDDSKSEPKRPRFSAKDIAHHLSKEIYKAAVGLCERAEHTHTILGNGHHMAQKLAEIARKEMVSRKV